MKTAGAPQGNRLICVKDFRVAGHLPAEKKQLLLTPPEVYTYQLAAKICAKQRDGPLNLNTKPKTWETSHEYFCEKL